MATTQTKKMKKLLIALLVIISIVLSIGFFYLIYKTWVVFGFWTLIWTGLVTGFSTLFLGNLIGSRSEKNGVITYNPKEWPKFLNIIVSVLIGYYLYTVITKPGVSSSDYTFGLAYLILLTGVPIIYAFYILIRDSRDFISIDDKSLKYKDNSETGDFKIEDIASVDLFNRSIILTFKDGAVKTIKTGQMNFNLKDLAFVYSDISKKIPEVTI